MCIGKSLIFVFRMTKKVIFSYSKSCLKYVYFIDSSPGSVIWISVLYKRTVYMNGELLLQESDWPQKMSKKQKKKPNFCQKIYWTYRNSFLSVNHFLLTGSSLLGEGFMPCFFLLPFSLSRLILYHLQEPPFWIR